MLLDPDLSQRMFTFASQAVVEQTPSTVASDSHAPTGSDRFVTAATSLVTASSGSGSSIFTISSQLSCHSVLHSINKTLAKTRVYKNARKNESTYSFNTTDTGHSRWSQLSGLSLSEISNVSVISLPVYIVELNNGQVYQQVMGIVADGKVRRGLLSSPGLQSLRRQSIKAAAYLRHRLLPVPDRESRLLDAAVKRNSVTIQDVPDWLAPHVDVGDANRRTSLHRAAASGHEATVRLLLEGGAKPDVTDDAENTPLHLAANGGHEATVRLLLDHGAEMGVKNMAADTPLHIAANGGHEAAAQLLLERGAEMGAKNWREDTPFHLAAYGGHEATVCLLLDRDAEAGVKNMAADTPLHIAANGGHEATVRLLLDYGAGMDVKGYWNETPLHCAAWGGHEATVRLLLDRGAEMNVKGYRGETPLQRAAERGYKSTVRLLLDRGADMGAENPTQNTPLHLAANGGHEFAAQLLLDRCAEVDVKNAEGGTPLHVARDCRRPATVRLLQN